MENGGRKKSGPEGSRASREFRAWLRRPGGIATIMVCLYVVVWGALLGILAGDITGQHETLVLFAAMGGGAALWGAARALLQQQRLLIRQESSDELEESRALVRILLDHLPAAACLKSADHRYLAANAAWARFAGCSLEHAIGRTDGELFELERAELYRGDDDAVFETGSPVERNLTVTLEDGEHQLHLLKVPVSSRPGKITDVVGLAFDMTAYVQRTQQLPSVPGFSPISVELPWSSVCVVDPQGHIVSMSADPRGLLGDVRGGSSVIDVVVPSERARAHAFLSSISDGSSAAVEQFHILEDRGVPCALRVWGVALRAGETTRAVALLSCDVTANGLEISDQG